MDDMAKIIHYIVQNSLRTCPHKGDDPTIPNYPESELVHAGVFPNNPEKFPRLCRLDVLYSSFRSTPLDRT
jgi:hypothetical protein